MKILLLIYILSVSVLLADELSWVDEQVNAIKPNRNGVSNAKISKLRSPFIYLKKNMSKKDLGASSSTAKVTADRTTTSSSSRKSTRTVSSIKTANGILYLSVIINSAALINDVWYKLGDTFSGYTIVKVSRTSVTLRKKKKTTVLTTKSEFNKLKFK